jgi:hypothetical protein
MVLEKTGRVGMTGHKGRVLKEIFSGKEGGPCPR